MPTKAQLKEKLNRSRAQYKVLLKERNRKIEKLEKEIAQVKRDVKNFGKIIKRFPRVPPES